MHPVLRAAQANALVGFDDRAFDIGGMGGHRGYDGALVSIFQPAILGIGAAQTQRFAGGKAGVGK